MDRRNFLRSDRRIKSEADHQEAKREAVEKLLRQAIPRPVSQ